MQFFLLLVINIFLGAVFYLIISLKLERSANEFRAKRLRREMDEIIAEFNATAERNISLLESRISALRRLLELSGNIKSLDITVGDDGAGASAPIHPPVEKVNEQAGVSGKEAPGEPGPARETGKKGLIGMMDKVINAFNSGRKGGYPADIGEEHPEEPANRHDGDDAHAPAAITQEEIAQIIAECDSRYALITRLRKRGCEAEDISRFSGIPLGEVKLVLNLNDSR